MEDFIISYRVIYECSKVKDYLPKDVGGYWGRPIVNMKYDKFTKQWRNHGIIDLKKDTETDPGYYYPEDYEKPRLSPFFDEDHTPRSAIKSISLGVLETYKPANGPTDDRSRELELNLNSTQQQ